MSKFKLISKKIFSCIILFSLFFSAVAQSHAQENIRVGGKVVDKDGLPLTGVSVLVKNTQTGTTTDLNGAFSVSVAKGSKLRFSYLGYNAAEHVADGTAMRVVMTENNELLDEVVVIGYGTQKKSDLTGSLSSVKGDDLIKSSGGNISQALQGKAAGVYITSNSGAPGAGAVIRVRGYGSISCDLTPLYVVDGQPIDESQVNHISPSDIESIEVLKDASACAIYGARGASGVVLISTKKGVPGKINITFDASCGVTQAVNRLEMMNSKQLYGFISEAYKNDGKRMPRGFTWLYTLDGEGKGPLDENGQPTDINVYDTDWWNECTQNGLRQNYNLSVSGGTDKLKSYFSVGHFSETGIIRTSDYKRYSIRINNEYTANKYITVGQTLGFSYVKSHDLSIPISEILLPDPFTPVIASNADKQDPNYEYNKYMGSQYSYYSNPVAAINRRKVENISRNIDGTAYININLGLKGFYFKTLFGFDIPNYSYYEFNPSFNIAPNDTDFNMCTNNESKFLLKNSAKERSSWSLNYSLQNTLNYMNTFGKHEISAMAGFTWEARQYRSMEALKASMPSNDEAFQFVGGGTVDDIVRGSRNEDYIISYLGRVNYNFDNRYLLTFSIRHDGSSKFARGYRWGTFPSFSAGWRIDRESFFRNLDRSDVVSMLKLRAGWGQNGNQYVPPFSFANTVSTFETWIYPFNSAQNTLQGYASTGTGTPNLKWETSEQANVGVDLAFLNNSLTFSGDLYLKTTRDLLLDNPLPLMAGYQSTPFTNVGEIQNKGIEMIVGYRNRVGDFTYAVNANFTIQRNKLVSTGDTKPIYGTVSKNEPGNPFGMFYGYVYDGIFQSDEEVQAHVGADGTTVLQPNAQPGDFRFRNVSNDNKLNDDDRTYIGNPNPKLIYGGNIALGYKGIELSVFLQGVAGNDIWANTKQLYRNTSATNLLAATYTDAWRKLGDNTDMPRVSTKDDNQNHRASSWFVQNGSFCKIKALQLSYTFPKKWIQATSVINNLRIYFNADNLCTITNFKFMDPEVPNGKPKDLGIENLQYPNPRVFTFGVNVQF